MNEIKKINPLSFLSTLEANPERDEWIKQREKELAEQAEKNLSFQYSSAKEVMKAYKERVQSITTEKYKPPKNSVGLYECIVTSTAGAIPEEREYEFFEKTYQQLCRTFGEKEKTEPAGQSPSRSLMQPTGPEARH